MLPQTKVAILQFHNLSSVDRQIFFKRQKIIISLKMYCITILLERIKYIKLNERIYFFILQETNLTWREI